MERDRADVAALVLAGGASSRFGVDKTRAELAGRPLLEHVLGAVDHVAGTILVVGPWAPSGREHRVERPGRRGPAAALAFGMHHVDAEHVLVVGGDHPLIVPEVLALLVELSVGGGADAVVPVRAGCDEPLVACYRRSVGRIAAELVGSGERSMRAVLGRVRVERVPEAVWRPLDPDGRSFLDVDTPEDLERLRDLDRR